MANGTRNRSSNGNGGAPTPIVPFASAAHEYTEQAFDVTGTPGSSTTQLGPFDVPAYGYIRHLLLQVDGSGGSQGDAVLHEDYPFNILKSVQFADVNGAPIYGPLDGFEVLCTNVIGGYMARDPRDLTDYDSSFETPSYILRIPLEISHRDGFGALANQHSAASYKVYITLASASDLVDSGSTQVEPEVRIRGWLEAWSLPDENDLVGRPQADTPPMLGTTMFHSQFVKDVQTGQNTILLPKVGNLLRYILVVSRNSDGDRSDAVFPDPARLVWDARTIRNESQKVARAHLEGALPSDHARDTGVHAYLMNHSIKNTVGDDSPQLWWPTVQSTRLEINGEIDTAGTHKIITCDVAPTEVQPQERYVETSLTGHQPVEGNPPQAAVRG